MDIKSCLIGLALLQVSFAAHLASVITQQDGQRLTQFFKAPYADLETAFYATSGYKQYIHSGSISAAEKDAACKLVKTCDTKSLMSIYQASTTLNNLGSACKHGFTEDTLKLLKSQISGKASDITALHAAVSALTSLGQNVDNDAVLNALLKIVKEDNSVVSSSLALLTASQLINPNLDALIKAIDIEDMTAQADEVDQRFLHFENDFEATSTFLSAVFAAGEVTKQSLAFSNDQIIMFSNYLLRSKQVVSTTKDAFLILNALGRVSSSSKVKVVRVDLVSGSAVSEETPAISVVVTSLFNEPVSKLTVKADSVALASDNAVVVSNAQFKFDGKSNYNLDLWKNKPKSGLYDVTLSVSSVGVTLVGVSDLYFKVKVTSQIELVNIQLGVPEKDQTGAALQSVTYPEKASSLRADAQQRIVMKFEVKDVRDGSLMEPHQAFVRFVELESKQEVVFIAEPDKTSAFKFEVDLAAAGRDQFGSVTGRYSMQLIVGDATISNPIFWNFGEIVLRLGDDRQKPKSSLSEHFQKKPEIHHMFRTPEERPPAAVSQAFTAACLLPILVLFVLWARVGANLGDFKLTPKHILFHVGVAAIFVLYYFFWSSFNMFQTLQYLTGIGTITFICGNMVLSDLANRR